MGLLFLFLLILVGGGIFVYCFAQDMRKPVREISNDLKRERNCQQSE
jgi:hypothetical protein